MPTKKRIWELLAPTLAWTIRIIVLSVIALLFAWYFGIGWQDFKDLFFAIIEII